MKQAFRIGLESGHLRFEDREVKREDVLNQVVEQTWNEKHKALTWKLMAQRESVVFFFCAPGRHSGLTEYLRVCQVNSLPPLF